MRTTTNAVSSQAPRAASAGLAVLLAAILGAAGVTSSLAFVVAARTAELRAGYALHALHQQRARLARQRAELRLEVASLLRPERLAKLSHELGLAPPTSAQVLPPRAAEKAEASQ